MLEVQGVTKIYNDVPVVNDISFRIKRGVIYGILGPNGAGKTTLLSIITGLLNPDKGKVLLEGLESYLPEYKRKIGFVSDVVNLYDYLTGREYIHFVASLRDVPRREQELEIERLSKIFQLEHQLDKFIKTYSKGMRQKTAIISALVHQPELLVLDEPFSGLDPIGLKEMKDYLIEYAKRGNSIVFSTHILEIVEKMCEHLMIIHSGRKIVEGNVNQLKSDLKLGDSTDLEHIFYKMISS